MNGNAPVIVIGKIVACPVSLYAAPRHIRPRNGDGARNARIDGTDEFVLYPLEFAHFGARFIKDGIYDGVLVSSSGKEEIAVVTVCKHINAGAHGRRIAEGAQVQNDAAALIVENRVRSELDLRKRIQERLR